MIIATLYETIAIYDIILEKRFRMKQILLPILSIFLLSACDANKSATIKGTIKYVGAAPHNYLALEDSNHHIFKVDNPQDFNLKSKQNQRVIAKVKLLKKPVGSGFPAVIQIVDILK